MSVICWNVRGLNNDICQLDLHNILAKYRSSIIALLENKFAKDNIDMFKN